MKSKKLYIFVILYISSFFMNAQNGLWTSYFVTYNIKNKEKFFIQSDAQYRSRDIFRLDNFNQSVVRMGIGHKISRSETSILSILGGYAFFVNNLNNKDSSIIYGFENRIYQQTNFITSILSNGNIFLINRIRLEERFLNDRVFSLRARYMMAFNFLLRKDTSNKRSYYIYTYNEIFFNLLKQDFGFDRNRFALFFGKILNQNIKLQIGLMRQELSDETRTDQVMISVYNSF